MTTLMTPSPAAQPFVDPVWDAEIPAVDFVGRALSGALTGRLVSEITELGVPDALVGGPRQPADLAAELGADADVLARVLRILPATIRIPTGGRRHGQAARLGPRLRCKRAEPLRAAAP